MKQFYNIVIFSFLIFQTLFGQNIQVGLPDSLNLFSKGNTSSQPLDGNAVLGNTYNKSMCGLNYVQASDIVSTRYTTNPGKGLPLTLSISNLPACYTVQQAYVYWSLSYSNTSSTTPTLTFTNTVGIVNTTNATTIGADIDKCWGYKGTRGARADVTNFISGNGNYILNVTGNTAKEIDGMTLLIIYTDPNATYYGTLLIDDGCVVDITGGNQKGSITNINACGASSVAKAFVMVGDFQDNISSTHEQTMNGSVGTFPNNFWNFDEVNTTVTSGQTTSAFKLNTSNTGDCYAWIARGIYFQTNTCTTCPNAPSIVITATVKNASCGANDGSIAANPSGGSSPYTYSWSNGASTSSATNLAVGTYSVTITDANGCSASYTDSITTGSSMNVTLTTIDATCGQNNGEASIVINSGTPPFSYLWSDGDTNTTDTSLVAGNYFIIVKDSAGCADSIGVLINDLPPPSISLDSVSELCYLQNGKAIVAITGGNGKSSIQWNDSLSQTLDTAVNLSSGWYKATVTDSSGCVVEDSIFVDEILPAVLSLSSINDFCNTSQGIALASASGGFGMYNFSWNTNPVQTGDSAYNLSAGMYTVQLTDSSCIVIDSVIVNGALVLPVSNFTFEEQTSLSQSKDAPVQFYNQSVNTQNVFWDFGDGSTSIENDPLHSYSDTGTYIVTLIATDSIGCTDTIIQTVIINGGFEVFIPNSFSPNADGINDFLK